MQHNMNLIRSVFILTIFVMAGFVWSADYDYSAIDKSMDPIDQALKSIGLDRESSVFPLTGAAVARDKEWEIPVYRSLIHRPFDIPYYVGHMEYNFNNYRDNFVRTLIFMTGRTGSTVARGYFSRPLATLEKRLEDSDDPVFLALQELHDFRNIPLDEARATSISESMSRLPEEVRFEVARLMATSAQAARWHEFAFKKVVESNYRHLMMNVPERVTPQHFNNNEMPTITEEWDRKVFSDLRPLMARIDYKYLFAGALDLMISLEKSREKIAEMPVDQEFYVRFATPLGWVTVAGNGENNLYNSKEHSLLIMDFGGNDVYRRGGGVSRPEYPVSMILDVSGDDSYIQAESGLESCFGSGIMGYGFHFDFQGDDRYVCPQFSQGSAFFGVGWLVDLSGDDAYESIRYSQGFAQGGIGFLYDREGDDVYYTVNSGQGCGNSRGCGMLVDEKGDDEYIADDNTIRFPSAQSRQHNRSTAQGAGMGERADEEDGHSLPGGMGVLMDFSGNDKYSAGVFAQGIGYWSGLGVLVDSDGNDEYSGVWYVQGAGVHGGIGFLVDRDGNDTYTATLHASMGIGHDDAIGMFIDEKGNDYYNAPRLSLGTANNNSLAFFFELAGNDEYVVDSPHSLGRAQFSRWGTMREDRLNLGLFLDAGGEDQYSSQHGRNNFLWKQKPSQGIVLKSEKGVGIDGEFSDVDLRLQPLTEKPPGVEW